MSSTLTIREIYDAARSAGFSPHQAVTWTAIAMAESGGRTGALNDNGEHSIGLWQINVEADASRATRWGDLSTPEANARAAYAISRQGRDMRPWTTTHDRHKGTGADYRTYLGKVETEIGIAGDPRGVHGYGSKMLVPLEESQYDQIDNGRALVDPDTDPWVGATGTVGPQQRDSDSDGLTDEFERLAGTDMTNADSDRDGLSDAYEARVSHTDPLLADTDADQVGDATELAQGADAGTVLGSAYVVGDGVFAEDLRSGATDADADGLSDRTEELVGTDPTAADTDTDGLTDTAEASLGTDPTAADTDVDGVTDGMEVRSGTDPLGPSGGPFDHEPTPAWTLHDAAQARAASTASKAGIYGSTGSVDGAETSSSDALATAGVAGGNGVVPDGRNGAPGLPGSGGVSRPGVPHGLPQGSTIADYAIDSGGPVAGLPGAGESDPDTDSDGLTDAFERLAGTAPTLADTDSDGLSDGNEAVVSHTDPLAADTDGDAISDAQELALGTDAGRLSGVAGVIGSGRYAENVRNGITDSDRDGLSDHVEELAGTNATLVDTDDDGLSDAAEASVGSDPLRADTDLDGVFDGVEVRFGSDPLNAASMIGPGSAASDLGADLVPGVVGPIEAGFGGGTEVDDAFGSAETLDLT